MCKKSKKYYRLSDSPFYCLKSQKKLADLLWISKSKLQDLARSENLYFDFQKPKGSESFRTISAPRPDLKQVQKRIADLLQRIAPPDYLFAPVAGRSYVDNAAVHLDAHSIRLLDIEDFFPSCTGNKVIWFFHKRMRCSIDVAAIIKGIVTKDESLPQGSPCSPILAFLCYIDMWEEIDQIVNRADCTLSVYADDLTVSGSVVPEASIWEIKETLYKHGHRYNRAKEQSKHLKPAEVTGVILSAGGLHVPNRQHKALHDLRHHLVRREDSSKDVEHMKAQLRGRESQMQQVASRNQSD